MSTASENAATGGNARLWLVYAFTTVVLWGVWGALSGLSPQYGFPETLVYCVWALTMIPPALVILGMAGWRIERSPKAIAYGAAIGLLGAGGQMILFYALTRGPAYFIFPIISLSPVVTIALSFLLLGERTGKLGTLGIVLALIALPMFDIAPGGDAVQIGTWVVPALLVMLCWGVQAYFMKAANTMMSAPSIFAYMTISGLALTPIAWAMTDFEQHINWSLTGPGLTAAIQILNAIGALTLVFAFRYGKAMVVAPLTNAGAPMVTAILSLVILGVAPGAIRAIGIAMALVASLLLAIEPDDSDAKQKRSSPQ